MIFVTEPAVVRRPAAPGSRGRIRRAPARQTPRRLLLSSKQVPIPAAPWRIEDEQGREVPSELVAAGGAKRLTSAPLERTGLYRVLQGGALRNTFAVNPAAQESDLAAVPEPALLRAFPPGRAQVLRPGADLALRVREARFGRELWAWFVIASLALLVTEMIIARSGMGGRMAEVGAA